MRQKRQDAIEEMQQQVSVGIRTSALSRIDASPSIHSKPGRNSMQGEAIKEDAGSPLALQRFTIQRLLGFRASENGDVRRVQGGGLGVRGFQLPSVDVLESALMT